MKKSLISILLLTVFAAHAHAGPPITIVRGQDYPPYHYFDQTGTETGFIVDIIRDVAVTMNLNIDFQQYPWSRCLELVKKGRADAMMNLFKTKERMAFMHFNDAVLGYEVNRFFKLKNYYINYSGDMATLFPLRLGAIRNYSYGKDFDSIAFPLLVELETEKDLIKSLVNKRCEIIVGNESVIQVLKERMGFKDYIEPVSPVVSRDPLYVGFSKALNHKRLSRKFSKALEDFKKTKSYAAILKNYGL